ncbi:MAG: 1,4-alpha-glucan branching protein GlgB [Dehalococcoidia bacterium]
MRNKSTSEQETSQNRPEAGNPVRNDFSLLTDEDLYLFNQGSHYRLHDKLGAHPVQIDETPGTYFAVWAPNASQVSVIGDFNAWDDSAHHLASKGESGIWEGFIPDTGDGTLYKYHIRSRHGDYTVDKADPFAFFCELPPATASIVRDIDYEWGDEQWMRTRTKFNDLKSPMCIYEMHPGSWRRKIEEENRYLTYRELAEELPGYLEEMGFTHVEFMPIMEHPFYGSWGYQITGFFAPTSRYGTPQDFMYLVDRLHQHNIAVILDWVPSHFPSDAHGLGYFDGTHLYEHSDPRQGIHPDWNSFIFNYGRHEVQSFLLSNAIFWLERYHIDGLRVDAVASMLYLDYARTGADWIPNKYGGNENLEAIDFLRRFNEVVYGETEGVHTIAEESTAWPSVSRPTYVGGLGFGLKWDMGWMHDTLEYMSREPIHRRYHHNLLTFRGMYAFSENFVLPLSHDEVVHGKASMLSKMPGDDWQKFANLRLLYGYMYAQPGKKLLFMGDEFGQRREWAHDESLEWYLLQYSPHQGLQRWVNDINHLCRSHPALYELDTSPAGFEWIDCQDMESSIISLIRRSAIKDETVIGVFNFTPVPRSNYRVGVPRSGFYREALNSDALDYGGSGEGNMGGLASVPIPSHGRFHSLTLNIPPLASLFLVLEQQPKL